MPKRVRPPASTVTTPERCRSSCFMVKSNAGLKSDTKSPLKAKAFYRGFTRMNADCKMLYHRGPVRLRSGQATEHRGTQDKHRGFQLPNYQLTQLPNRFIHQSACRLRGR